MCAFVGAEYLIANALIALKTKGINEISFCKLNGYGVTVERQCSEKNIEVVLLLSSDKINDAIYNFSDYFSLGVDETTGESVVKIKKDTDVTDLKERFIGYLPLDVIKILLKEARSIAAA